MENAVKKLLRINIRKKMKRRNINPAYHCLTTRSTFVIRMRYNITTQYILFGMKMCTYTFNSMLCASINIRLPSWNLWFYFFIIFSHVCTVVLISKFIQHGKFENAGTPFYRNKIFLVQTHNVRVRTRDNERERERELIKIDFYREKIYDNNIFV